MLKRQLGETRLVEEVGTGLAGSALVAGGAVFKEERYNVPLLAEHELSRILARDEERILIATAAGAIIARRMIYYRKTGKDARFIGLYDEA